MLPDAEGGTMSQYWCTYCDHGLVNERQKEAHEDAGHVTHEVEYKRPQEDRYVNDE